MYRKCYIFIAIIFLATICSSCTEKENYKEFHPAHEFITSLKEKYVDGYQFDDGYYEYSRQYLYMNSHLDERDFDKDSVESRFIGNLTSINHNGENGKISANATTFKSYTIYTSYNDQHEIYRIKKLNYNYNGLNYYKSLESKNVSHPDFEYVFLSVGSDNLQQVYFNLDFYDLSYYIELYDNLLNSKIQSLVDKYQFLHVNDSLIIYHTHIVDAKEYKQTIIEFIFDKNLNITQIIKSTNYDSQDDSVNSYIAKEIFRPCENITVSVPNNYELYFEKEYEGIDFTGLAKDDKIFLSNSMYGYSREELSLLF